MEVERNSQLIELITKLNKEGDFKSIALLGTLIKNDTKAMQFSFKIMTENTPISNFFGLDKMSDLGK